MSVSRLSRLVTAVALVVGLWSVYTLESAVQSVETDHVMLGDTPATIYSDATAEGGLAIVAHGFGGSRQMMQAISLTLAQAGHTVVAFDFIGHGRHAAALSPAITTLTGTTEDLVQQTVRVAQAAQQRTGQSDVSFVGHSMATDVIVRAAERLGNTDAVVAISMYSEAVTPSHPARLLVVSGAFESRLRAVALDAVAQIGPAQEGETVRSDGVARRAVAAPWVGHVGVLWSSVTLTEIVGWLGRPATPVAIGKWIAALLFWIVVLFWGLSRLLPVVASPPSATLRHGAVAAFVGSVGAGLGAATGAPLIGLAGFGALGLAFGIWGLLVLLILRPSFRISAGPVLGGLVLVAWGLGAFALALDRYGAAFIPTGPRLSLALILLPAALLFGLADRVLVQGRGLIARIALRMPFLVAVSLAMAFSPTELGLVFTVLPVLVLYWLVYGTMAMWVSQRSGPVAAGLGSGIILAWAIAASTPLFQA